MRASSLLDTLVAELLALPEGKRNDELWRKALVALETGHDPDEVREAFMSAGPAVGLTAKETAASVASAFRRASVPDDERLPEGVAPVAPEHWEDLWLGRHPRLIGVKPDKSPGEKWQYPWTEDSREPRDDLPYYAIVIPPGVGVLDIDDPAQFETTGLKVPGDAPGYPSISGKPGKVHRWMRLDPNRPYPRRKTGAWPGADRLVGGFGIANIKSLDYIDYVGDLDVLPFAPDWFYEDYEAPNAGEATTTTGASGLTTVNLGDIEPRAVTWAWRHWLPRGSVTIYDGNPGDAKSTLVVDLTARLTTGGEWPDGTPVGQPKRVIYVTTEDDDDTTVLPRLIVAGGNRHLVNFLSSFEMPRDGDRLTQLIRDFGDVGLVFIDPLFGHVEENVRTISDVEMRKRVMAPLRQVARDTEVSILATRHNSKDTGASPLNRGAGSLGGIAGAARMVLASRTDPDTDGGYLFGVVKSSYGPKDLTMRYHVEGRSLPGWDAADTVSRVVWDGTSHVSIEDISAETDHGEARDAESVLTDILRGEVSVKSDEVAKRMKQKGFGRDATRSARKRIGAKLVKDGFQGDWVMYLPDPLYAPKT